MKGSYAFLIIIILIITAPFIYASYIQYVNNSSDEYVVCAFYYPWYGQRGDGIDFWYESVPEPLLGKYNSRNLTAIKQHDSWAENHGIDVFFISWWGEGSWEDVTLKDYILPNLEDTKFAILYESEFLLKKTSADTTTWWGSFYNYKIDFNDPENKERLIDDFRYISSTYFDHPLYYKIDGKPVVYIYSAKIFYGDYVDALASIREDMKMLTGYEMYLVGDVVYWQPSILSVDVARHFDGINAYNMVIPLPEIEIDFVGKCVYRYGEWKIFSDTIGVDFIPTVIAGYDETKPESTAPVIPKDVGQFERFCNEVKKYVPENGLIFVTSFNEWFEGTQIESDKQGEYGNSYLEIIRNAYSES
ncbi:MAG: glycoside hydrolase family 99-like domain-containing protein [Candidatus Methylarchaceae archaeon HK01B]|nr:glycoside hydrolase family 99-like domain-containing protein [Candidatus Methylarchaceae archaeon HK01B]